MRSRQTLNKLALFSWILSFSFANADVMEEKASKLLLESNLLSSNETVTGNPISLWFQHFKLERSKLVSHQLIPSTGAALFKFQPHDQKIPKLSKSPKQVLLIPGYAEHCGYVTKIIDSMTDKGHEVYCLDLPNHGLSKTEVKWSIADFSSYTRTAYDVLKLLKNPTVICHSTGCSGVLDLLLNDPMQTIATLDYDIDYLERTKREHFIERLVLLAPLTKTKLHLLINTALPLFQLPTLKTKDLIPSDMLTGYDGLDTIKKIDPLFSNQVSLNWLRAYKRWHRNRKWEKSSNVDTLLVLDPYQDDAISIDEAYDLITKHFFDRKTKFVEDANHFLWLRPDAFVM